MTREEAIDYLLDPIGKREKHDEAIRMAIEALERQRGEWVEAYEDYRQQISWWECSVCRYGVSWKPNYCPNCGADMRGEENDKG